MDAARIAELLQPFLGSANDEQLAPHDFERISTYIDMLLNWNARINLTAIRDPAEIVMRHFGESLFAARHLFPARAQATRSRLADIGSGAGFPGLPIKLWAPEIALTAIESNNKKAAFLREVTRALALTDVNIDNARAETVAPVSFEVVTLRAVERFANILPIAARLLIPGGRLALLVSSSQITVAGALPNVSWEPPIAIPKSQSRLLLIGTRNLVSK